RNGLRHAGGLSCAQCWRDIITSISVVYVESTKLESWRHIPSDKTSKNKPCDQPAIQISDQIRHFGPGKLRPAHILFLHDVEHRGAVPKHGRGDRDRRVTFRRGRKIRGAELSSLPFV